MTEPAMPVAQINVARVFDAVDPEIGPSFAPDHPMMADGPERERVLAYLGAGVELLVTAGAMTDIIDPDRGAVVPMSFRTDGAWIWTDTVTYYLAEHGVAPDPELLGHIQASDRVPTELGEQTIQAAFEALTAPSDDEPVWQVDAEVLTDDEMGLDPAESDGEPADAGPPPSWWEEVIARFDAEELRELDSVFEKVAAPLGPGEVGGSGQLTQHERELVVRAQQLVVIAPDTRMRKPIAGADVERYLTGQRRGITGFVTRDQDVPDSAAGAPESYGIEFRAGMPDRYRVPLGAPYGASSMRTAQDRVVLRAGAQMVEATRGAGLDANARVRHDDEWPYTGIGVSAGIPQRWLDGPKDFEDGDTVYRYPESGERVPLARFDGRTGRWVRQP